MVVTEIMNFVNFEIVRIVAGWFDVKFVTNEKQVEISASDAWGNDSPRYFLRMIIDFFCNKINAGYVIFDEEPGIYIVCIESNDEPQLSILYSGFDDNEVKIDVHGNLTRKEIEGLLADTEELLSVSDFSLQLFANTLFRSFDEWSSKSKMNEYEWNWMVFPKAEIEQLSMLIHKRVI